MKGKTGAEGLNGALNYGGPAGRYSAQVTNAFLGTSPGDLSRLVAGAGRTFGALARREADLQGLIVNFDTFTGALAAQSAEPLDHRAAARADAEDRPQVAGQPQPHRCRRCAPGRSSSARRSPSCPR